MQALASDETQGSAALSVAVAVVVVAAGAGNRLAAGVPKAFAPLGGSTLLELAIDAVRQAGTLSQLIVVAPMDRLGEAAAIARRVYGDDDYGRLVTVIPGGAERADSVAAGLRALAPSVQVVLIHDAARALTPPELFDAVAGLVVKLGSGVVPVLPVYDTVKRMMPDGEVVGTLDRSGLVLTQTPQGFPRDLIGSAYAVMGPATISYTDDAAIVSAAGHRVVSTQGSERAFKITVPQDLLRAEAMLRGVPPLGVQAPAPDLRTGVGVDAHAFADDVPLRLGGLAWPGEPAGLAGHSDGDAVCHAIVDALLTASGLGDIGQLFGTDDPATAGRSGAAFLRETVAFLHIKGWTVQNAAVEIVASRPRIGPRREEMEQVLSEALGAPVTIAATTTDGLGLTGEGRGVGAIATALVARK